MISQSTIGSRKKWLIAPWKPPWHWDTETLYLVNMSGRSSRDSWILFSFSSRQLNLSSMISCLVIIIKISIKDHQISGWLDLTYCSHRSLSRTQNSGSEIPIVSFSRKILGTWYPLYMLVCLKYSICINILTNKALAVKYFILKDPDPCCPITLR